MTPLPSPRWLLTGTLAVALPLSSQLHAVQVRLLFASLDLADWFMRNLSPSLRGGHLGPDSGYSDFVAHASLSAPVALWTVLTICIPALIAPAHRGRVASLAAGVFLLQTLVGILTVPLSAAVASSLAACATAWFWRVMCPSGPPTSQHPPLPDTHW